MAIALPPLSRDKANALLLLATCVLVLAPHASHLPLWIVVASSAILLWRGWITFRGQRLPPRSLLIPIAILGIVGMYWQYHTILGREVGVAMLVLLLTLKLMEMRGKRDLFVVLFLSFFLVLANFFHSQSIGTAILMFVTTLAILTTQLSFHYTGEMPPLTQRLHLGGFILLLAVPLTLVLFLLFPRIQGPLWGRPTDVPGAHTGLSDNMSPGNIASLALSDDVAFRVKFLDAPPLQSHLYWRGPVLGNYDGRTWTALAPRRFPRIPAIAAHGAPIHYEVTMEPSNQQWLFALELPQAPPILKGRRAVIGADYELLNITPINERVRYAVSSIVNFDLQPADDAAMLQRWLTLPDGFNPRTLAFAAQLRSNTSNDAQRIKLVLQFFRREKFRYTLQPPPLGTQAIDEFLFDTRAGFCEHYAGAFVVLMRAMGIPARVVTGYQGGEINPNDGYMTVRQSDAHAWAEVWLARRGWVRVDPTAAVSPARIEHNLAEALPRNDDVLSLFNRKDSWWATLQDAWRFRWDATTNAWNQWVLNYTPARQRDFISSFGLRNVDWHTLILLMVAFGSLITAIVVVPLVWQRQKRDPLDAIYRTFCQRLAHLGPAYVRLAHEGPRAYAERLATLPLAPEKKAAIARFLACYELARYGTMNANQSPASPLHQLQSLLAECR